MSEIIKNKKVAIILFNLGGPYNQDSVKGFLYNLFSDKYILRFPKYIRQFCAFLLAAKRTSPAKEIYAQLGGKSPILKETQNQADALLKQLKKKKQNIEFEIFVCMRHWHPMADKVVLGVEKFNPDEIISIPLYPQFSTTTSLSSIEDFQQKMKKLLPEKNYKTICCYPENEDFIEAHLALIKDELAKIKNINDYRILFSAHGLPERIVNKGDPYQYQVEKTVELIVKKLAIEKLDYKACYQSRVGLLEWIKPYTEDEIKLAGKQRKNLIIVPISFVSEHSETLVELDIEYKEIADRYHIDYIRVPALRCHDKFIQGLANIVETSLAQQDKINFISSDQMKRICPKDYQNCPCNESIS